jgi:two-component system, OmpR family, sensor kinase
LTRGNKVIALTTTANTLHQNPLYFIFITLFYSAIALVIFLWVWPLSRDLSRLIQHTREVGAQGTPASISLSKGSLLSPFANAFNAMAARLGDIMRSQKEMTYAVSHELRTPLARMKFALAMTEDLQLAPGPLRQLESVKRDVVEMEGLINSLLAYATFEQKAEPLDQREGHMEALICTMAQRFDNPLGIKITVCNESPETIFVCEWGLMQTALHNLLQNALGFAGQNIIVTMGASEQSYWVTVEDDGPGVPEAQREHIFESFVRLYGESNLNRHSGFGLGLAIVKRVITWHRGSVICSQAAQGGAKFKLQWPKM